MSDALASVPEVFRRILKPLEPVATDEAPRLEGAPTKAVLFDIYGTLLVSGTGDIGVVAGGSPGDAAEEACAAVGLERVGCPGDEVVAGLKSQIQASHAAARTCGIEYPEVEITQIWERTVQALARRGKLAGSFAKLDPRRLSVEYEARSNPTWTMPGAVETLAALRDQGLLIGIVSNAQFFTLELTELLLGGSRRALGIDPELEFYSYRFGEGKPSERMYEAARRRLNQRGVAPEETLYIGNDLLNDVRPANRVGFRSALFAGDRRSLRRRVDDPRVDGVVADVVLTRLNQTLQCFA